MWIDSDVSTRHGVSPLRSLFGQQAQQTNCGRPIKPSVVLASGQSGCHAPRWMDAIFAGFNWQPKREALWGCCFDLRDCAVNPLGQTCNGWCSLFPPKELGGCTWSLCVAAGGLPGKSCNWNSTNKRALGARSAMRRIMCIHLPNWPIQRLLAAHPELDASQPILLWRDSSRGRLVSACNAQCRMLDMPLSEAAALTGRCCILPSDPTADLKALSGLAEHCERFSPLVGWDSPDSLLLDVTGIGALFRGEERLASEVSADLASMGYRARVAIAGTVGAAWALATENSVANPIVVASADLSVIGPLPLSALRLPGDTIDLLGQLGIVQIDQLLQLPRCSLSARFGERLLLRVDQLFGTIQETIAAHRPQPTFFVEEVLEHPIESLALIEHVVRELVNRIARMLAPRQQGAVRLFGRLDCAPGPLTFHVGLFRPSADPQHLWDLVRMQLALPGPVGRVTLAAPQIAPLENRQRELFAGSHDVSRQLNLLIDRLSSRLGASAVLRPEPTADPLPERAVRYVPLIELARKRRASKSPPYSAATRPLTLHSLPRALEVVSVVPDGPPVSFRLSGRMHRITHWWGPERIESGWWRGRSVRRDYYRVETESGQRYWIFRHLTDGMWFMHGEFS